MIWITGLSGAGKTTLARQVQAMLRDRQTPSLLLDGDRLREVFADPTYGYDRGSRLRGAHRYARLAAMVAEQGLVAVVATISLFHEIHDWNRANLPGYFEVFLDVPEPVRRLRDPKGLYRSHALGTTSAMDGLDQAVESPISPHLRIENTDGPEAIPSHAARIVSMFLEASP
ncbi:MAG: adenylyl-sulfate kinase [Fibrobacteres bacterium]|nr:adenylyl-sulfate kinase [Fibrobacterota bacterium]